MEAQIKRRVRPVQVASRRAIFTPCENGTVYVQCPEPLGPYSDRVTDRLEFWASHAPERIFLAQRVKSGQWQEVTYSSALARVRNLASGLLRHGASAKRPLMILSGNSIEHGLLALAAMYVGIPYAPIAPAYSLAVKEFAALTHVWQNFEPGMVF